MLTKPSLGRLEVQDRDLSSSPKETGVWRWHRQLGCIVRGGVQWRNAKVGSSALV